MPARGNVADVDIDLARLFSSLWRNAWKIGVACLVVTALAWVAANMATPEFQAQTRIFIDQRESVFTQPQGERASRDDPNLDEEGVQSQVEILNSPDLARTVIEKLGLQDLREFDKAIDPSLPSRILVVLGLKTDPASIPREDRVLSEFRDKLSVFRVEKSRIIVAEFSSEDPKLAAAVPTALAEAYIELQKAAKLQADDDATKYLGPEIDAIRARVREAEARVAEYRASSDLLIGQNNAVLATQQLSELSTEMSRIRAERTGAEARAAAVRDALNSGVALDANPDVLASGLIQRLREREIQLNADIADLSTSLLPNHPRIKALRSQLDGLSAQIRTEARKIMQSLEREAEIARIREGELVRDLNRLKAEASRANEEEVGLKALERDAKAERDLLESYEQRYREASSRTQNRYLPVDAWISSRATQPAEPYFPKKLPIVGAAFVGSLLVFSLFALVAELLSGRAFTPTGRIAPQMPAAGETAGLAESDSRTDRAFASEASLQSTVPADPRDAEHAGRAAPGPSAMTALADRAAANANAHPRPSATVEPQTPDVEEQYTIAGVARQLAKTGASRVIVVSPEGDLSSAASALLTRELAAAGLHAVLLDLTGTGAAAQPMLKGRQLPGITDLLSSQVSFASVIHADTESEAHVIPTGEADPERAMRAVERLPMIADALGAAYDIVVIECGATAAAGIRRLAAQGAEVVMSVQEPADAAILEAASDLYGAGFENLMLMAAKGYRPPFAPGGRSAA